jgi:hypothetical protein
MRGGWDAKAVAIFLISGIKEVSFVYYAKNSQNSRDNAYIYFKRDDYYCY